MANYIVNLERMQAIEIMVDVDDPFKAMDAAKEKLMHEGVDWSQSRVDQVVGRCLATGDGGFEVLYQKDAAVETPQDV